MINLRRYVDLSFDKKCSTITTSFNEGDVLNCELIKLAMVKNNTKLYDKNFLKFFEYF